MKRIAFILSAFFVMTMAKAQTTVAPQDVNKLFEFTNSDYDFGKITFGKPVKYDVFIKNIGMDSASLENVQVGCHCTTPEYEKGKRFGPGQTIKVTLGFSGDQMGIFNKVATIYLSGGISKVVTFKGETFTPPSNPAPANAATEKLKSPSSN